MTIRNFLISMGAVCALVLLMPLYANASYQAPDGNTYNVKYHYYQNYQYQQLVFDVDYYFQKPVAVYDGKWWIWDDSLNSRHQLDFRTATAGTYTNNTTYVKYTNPSTNPSSCPDYCMSVSSGGTGLTVNPYPSYPTSTGDFPTFTNVSDLDAYLQQTFVDMENIVYDPFIPTPEFTVTYLPNSSSATQFFPVEVDLTNNTSDYYVEIMMENLTPSYLGVSPKEQSSTGISTGNYVVYKFYQFESHPIADKYDFVYADTMTSGVLNGLFSSAWRTDILSYSSSNVEITNASGNESFNSSPIFTALKNSWLNTYRNVACFYGNNTGISVRYFQVRDGVAYGGKVKSWTSLYQGKFSESIPDYYNPYDTAQGYEREKITDIVPVETTNPMADLPRNQYGDKTGLNININMGSNVPNYPDYPTIASYNLDNLLISTIDNVKGLGSFFSGFAGFCTVTFAWIPQQIWQIIAIGFALSIVVMFLKIL